MQPATTTERVKEKILFYEANNLKHIIKKYRKN